MKRKRVVVFGSTGSIGRATLEVIEHLSDRFELLAIASRSSTALIEEQAHRFRPRSVVITDPTAARKVTGRLGSSRVLSGPERLVELAASPKTDILVMAMSGTAGLPAVIAGLKQGKTVALATKEILVGFGAVVMRVARRHGGTVLPIDSELAALHQSLDGRNRSEVRRVIITASGGPFWRTGLPNHATVAQVLRHPTWSMGKKITVDSATLMNKGLEMIETVRLFALRPEQVETVLHPQSIVHALVEFQDGSLIAQLSQPDMRLPIQYCLTYPRRLPSLVQPLDLTRVGRLEFYPIDRRRFPCLGIAYDAIRSGGVAPCVMNAANQVAVDAFLAGRIAFGLIPDIISKTMAAQKRMLKVGKTTLRSLLLAERWATEFALGLVAQAACQSSGKER